MSTINEVQGVGHRSRFVGEVVTVEGVIVTAVSDDGFYIQDPSGDRDPRTSDGIFVFTDSLPTVSVGDEVNVTGEVSEFQPGGEENRNLTTTQFAFPDNIEVVSEGNPLPKPAIIGEGGRIPPSDNIDDDAFAEFNPDQAGIDFFESLEGMLVTAQNPVAVGPTNRFQEIFTVVNKGEAATGISDRGTLNISPDDFNPEKVQIDFERDLLPEFDFPQVNVGAQLGDVTGVVSYSFGNFEILPTEEFAVTPSELAAETTTLESGDQTLTLASYNVLNLDPNDEDGDTDVADGRFDAIAEQIVNNLNTPDVIGLQEIQDNDGEEISDVSAADETLQLLVDRIAAAGGPTYEFIDTEGIVPAFTDEDGNVVRPTGGAPGGNIRNAFLYNPERVALVDSDPLTDPQDQAQNPDNPFFGSRIPLSATFEFNGQEVTVISNHFSSKGGSSAILGLDQPFEELQNGAQKDLPEETLNELDPADRFVNGSYNEREIQAQAVTDYVDNLGPENIVALGDFNEFEFVDPVQEILGSSLTNLVDMIPADERYSFIFQGNSQQLDHILVSDNLAEQAQFDIVHTNVEFPSTAERASDHEPLLATVNLSETENNMAIELNAIGTFQTGIFDEGAAEIVAHDPTTQSLFVINSDATTVDILDVSDPTNPVANPMTEGQEVADIPDGPATGDFIWTLTGNELTVRGTFSGLSSDLFLVGPEQDAEGNPQSAIHVHTGVAGENGPILRNLTVNPTGDGRSGTFEGEFTLTDEELQSIEGLYVNLHTENFNGGEIRGQLVNPSIDATEFGDGANSIDVANGFAAVAIEGEAIDDNGQVLVFSTTSGESTTFEVGVLPDMLTFTPDGTKILVANEGEPSDDYSIDPEGSISIIDATTGEVSTADFTAFNDQKEALLNRGVRIFGPNATVAQDLEPEYITVTPDSSTAYVSLQENNALAVVDIENAEVLDILPLGFKDHSKGLPTLEHFEISDEVLEANPLQTPDGISDIPLGGLSGLFFEGVADNGNFQFITHPDRGPDLGSEDLDGDGNNDVRVFALPDFQPSLYRFELNPESGDITFTETIGLTRQDGIPLTGLPNLEGDDSGRQGQDADGNLLDFDPFGADMEGVVVNPADGTFWTVDEYRPSIYHFEEDGTLINRYVPQGTDPDTSDDVTFGTETLPEAYLSARDNRGFEAVSLDTEEGILYAFIQTPLGTDGTEEFNRDISDDSQVIRMLGIDPATGQPVAEYVYLLEKPAFSEGNIDKIGAATFAGDGKFFVVERDSGTEPTSNKVVYEINLSGATNVLGETFDDTTLEQLNADQLAEQGIRAVSKTEVTNLPSLGYLPSDKPEGIAQLPDGSLAVLNDNDFEPENKDTSLGIVSFDQSNELDASDEDGINFQNIPSLGMLQPDSIDSFEGEDGQTFIITANEGDARDYDGFSEEVGLDDLLEDGLLDLDDDNAVDTGDTVISTGETINDLLAENRLGELDFTSATGDIDGDGLIEQLYNYGGRSFSIFDEFGNLVFDSGDDFEKIIAQQIEDGILPEIAFNNNNDENEFDSRSDAKGPEPEAIVVGEVDDTTYAFIGLERIGGIIVYNLSDPTSPEFVQYLNNRNFVDDNGDPISVQLEDESLNPAVGDLGPEGFDFISAEESPNGNPLLAVGNEVSGTTTLYNVADIGQEEPSEPSEPSESFTLQLFHASDLEGGVDAIDNAPNFAAIIDQLEEEFENTLTISAGDNVIPGPFFNAALFTESQVFNDAANTLFELPSDVNGDGQPEQYESLAGDRGRIDMSIMNAIEFDASAIGNHEFDGGSDTVAGFIAPDFGDEAGLADDEWLGTQFPYLSANLDFSNDNSLSSLATDQILFEGEFVTGPEESFFEEITPRIAPAAIFERGGEQIGVVGATTPLLQELSSPGDTEIVGPSENNVQALADVLQPVIDEITDQGVNKIILTTHLQQIALEQELIGELSGVDIVIAGGSDTLLADETDTLRAGDEADNNYPLLTENADGDPAAIVSSAGEYSYVGRLVAEFDANGVLVPESINPEVSGAFATTEDIVTAVSGNTDPFAEGTKGSQVQNLVNSVEAIVNEQDGNLFGQTEVFLDGRREEVRTEETNLGNLTADANLATAQAEDESVVVSIKNGGGIRAPIGEVGDNGELLPPQANPDTGKEDGQISQLDLVNSLRFNNGLTLLTVTRSELEQLIEHGVADTAPGNTPGQFPQVGGLEFSFDPTQQAIEFNDDGSLVTDGDRVQSLAITDDNGEPIDVIVENGELVGNPDEEIRLVTLNFLADGGDGYPFDDFGENRIDLVDSEAERTGEATFADDGSEQDALAEFLVENFPIGGNTAFDEAETAPAEDERIVNLSVQNGEVEPPESPESPESAVLEEPGVFDLTNEDVFGPAGEVVTANLASEVISLGVFNNLVGFYTVADEAGGIDTDEDGIVDLTPGEDGYTEAAFANAEDAILKEGQTGSIEFTSGEIVVPFLLAQGGDFNEIPGELPAGVQAYFPYLAANADGADHFRFLSDNTLGIEDLKGGGDQDFNDFVFELDFA